jgi:GT2 family glycosyltransferase
MPAHGPLQPNSPPSGLPLVSVLMPIRDEAGHVERSLGAVLAQDYPAERLEILVVDGGSGDDSRDRVARCAAGAQQRVRILDNPAGHVTAGLNVALRHATGAVLVRVDGHSEVPADFIRLSVEALDRTGADCVGGPIVTRGSGLVGRALAAAMSSRFGTGGAAFRLESGSEREVDTVAFAAYRRDVFDRVGPFDERLPCNQDDELHLRLRQAGGRIVLCPELRATYFCRDSLAAAFRQYFRYGRHKLRVFQLRRARPTLRSVVPALFVQALAWAAVWAALTGDVRPLAWVALPYIAASVLASLGAAARHGLGLLPVLPAAYLALHAGYGIGLMVAACDRLTPALPPGRSRAAAGGAE